MNPHFHSDWKEDGGAERGHHDGAGQESLKQSDRDKGGSGIFEAISAGDYEAVKDILKNDLSAISAKYRDSVTPLHAACVKGNLKIAGLLISMGADITASI